MVNFITLVGRIKDKNIIENKEGKKILQIKVKVDRCFKNEKGEYDYDIIGVLLFNGIAENTLQYCDVGDLIGVKGRLQNLHGEETTKIVAEKITFLQNGDKNE